MRSSTLLAAAASLSTASAAIQGFNYGSTKTDGSFMYEQDFQDKFSTAKNLVGTSGFASARLYTMIQGGSSTNEPTQAIAAAITEDTSLLLGLWASGGQDGINAEIIALKAAISKWGDDFTSRVVGISVGSEDLYRVSPTGIAAKSGYGAEPSELVSYIKQVRSAIAGTSLSGAQIGHVDTWTSWVNGSNSAVAENCDWIGFDAYPYFQNSMSNGIGSGKQLFNDALEATKKAVGGKDVWITETGWPVSGPTENLAIPSTENAETYWQEVGCPLFGNVNTWWFTLQDSDPSVPSPSFGIVGSSLSTKPLFDLSCNAKSSSSSASKSSSASSTAHSASASASASGSSAASSTEESSPSSTSGSDSSAASSAATNAVSSGGALSPSHGGGVSVVSSTAIVTGTSGSGNSTPVATQTPSAVVPTTNGSKGVSTSAGSLLAAVGAVFAAFVAL